MNDFTKWFLMLFIAFLTGLIFGVRVKTHKLILRHYEAKMATEIPLPILSPELILISYQEKGAWSVDIKK